MLKEMGLVEFLETTASKKPVPGGGSIAALSGSLGSALTEMVANLTIGKEKYSDVEDEMIEVQKKAESLRLEFIDLIDKDANSFSGVMKAFKMPKSTDEEKQIRKETIQKEYKYATSVPFEVAQKAYEILDIALAVIEKGNKNAVTDGAVATMMARTAVLSALLNVKINLSSIKDEAFVSDMTEKVNNLEKNVMIKEKEILSKVNL